MSSARHMDLSTFYVELPSHSWALVDSIPGVEVVRRWVGDRGSFIHPPKTSHEAHDGQRSLLLLPGNLFRGHDDRDVGGC